MSLIYLTFANNERNPLPTLREEEDKIYSYLIRRAQQGHFDVQRESFATIPKITERINLFKKELTVFHYSGHADEHSLIVEDGPAFATGITELLGQCPKLKLIILNGCATYGQLKELQKLKTNPVIIYTHAPVGDQAANLFATSFYRNLSDHYESIQNAFDTGISTAKSLNKNISIQRGIGHANVSEPRSTWGLSSNDVFKLGWKLPAKQAIQGGLKTFPNEVLLDKIMPPLAVFDDGVKLVLTLEEQRGYTNILDRREAILKAFPHPLSEQLRKLIVPEKEDAHEYYNQIGLPRLRQLITTYETFIELLAFSFLAQLWEAFSDGADISIGEIPKSQLRRLFEADFNFQSTFSFLEIVQAVEEIFRKNEINYFFDELNEKTQAFTAKSSFRDAATWLKQMRSRLQGISGTPVEEKELSQLCIAGEKYLAEVITHLCFFAKYHIVCIKDIGVLKFRHLKEPSFRHRIVRLIQRFVGLEEQYEEWDDFLESASVFFLHKNGDKKRILNLTPFVIDHNAFDPKASLTKLLYFNRYQKDMDAYAFKHVYKPDDLPLVIRSESHFMVIKEQFDDFSKLIFNQTLRSL